MGNRALKAVHFSQNQVHESPDMFVDDDTKANVCRRPNTRSQLKVECPKSEVKPRMRHPTKQVRPKDDFSHKSPSCNQMSSRPRI